MTEESEPGIMELVFDQLEELLVTIIDEVRERPGVAVAILAALGGAIVGSTLANRSNRKRTAAAAELVEKQSRGVGHTGNLLGLAMRLLQNPIVRGFVLSMVVRQIRRRVAG